MGEVLIEAAEIVRTGIGVEDFEAIVRDHQKRIYRILYLLVHDRDEADNLTQECFLRAFARGAHFRGDASIGTWLVRIAINLAQDHLKSRRASFWRRLLRGEKQEERVRAVANSAPSPEATVMAKDRVAAVWAAAERLPMRQRTAFMLRYGEDLTVTEIADAMNLRAGTVKAHLSGATSAVRRELIQADSGKP